MKLGGLGTTQRRQDQYTSHFFFPSFTAAQLAKIVSIQVYDISSEVRTHCEIVITISLCPTPHSYHFVCLCVARTLKMHSLGKFQVFNTLRLTTVTVLQMRYLNLFILRMEGCTSDKHLPDFPSLPAPGIYQSTLWFQESDVFRFYRSARSHSIPLSLAYFTQHNVPWVHHPGCHKQQDFLHFYGQIYIYILNPLLCLHFGFFHTLAVVNKGRINAHGSADIASRYWFHFLWTQIQKCDC